MSDTLVIDDLDQLKALTDPLRQRILATICCTPATTKQIADQLGEKPTRLYHHVDLLEDAELIRLVETRQKRGTIEKYYQACATKFVVDHEIFQVDPDHASNEMHAVLVNTLQANLLEARDFFDHGPSADDECCDSLVLAQTHLKLTDEQARRLVDKLSECLEECRDLNGSEEGRSFALTVAFFPVRQEIIKEDTT